MLDVKHFSMDLSSTKRSGVNYTKDLSRGAGRVLEEFISDMCYGVIASGSTILADIAHALQEPSRLRNRSFEFESVPTLMSIH